MIILDSARKHGISDDDMLDVVEDPIAYYRLRTEPLKLLLLGFDSNARPIEIITDTDDDEQILLIHANKITKENMKLLEEALQ